MLSLALMKAGQCDYYVNLAREDYYLAGGEPAGVWHGQGAATLGLTGQVAKEQLAAVFQGFSPDHKQLVQNAGKRRQSGWDLTFSAAKSVSVLWALSDPRTQQAIEAAHETAVRAALDYLEENFLFSRVGRGGGERTKGNLVAAIFLHSCSRALDPALHSHALVMNVAPGEDGQTRAILSKNFYQAKMLLGAYYRAVLAQELIERLGVQLERPLTRRGPASWFEIQGVPKAVLAHFSKRRAAIEAELGKRGLETAAAAAYATLSTRETKTIVPPRAELYARWKAEGRALGFVPEEVLARGKKLSPAAAERELHRLLREAVGELTTRGNHFTQAEVTQRVLEASPVSGLSAAAITRHVADALVYDPEFVSLGARNGQALWTTETVLRSEKDFRHSVAELSTRRCAGVSAARLEAVLTSPRDEGDQEILLDAQQQEAVRYLCQRDSACLKVVSGFPGTGKTEVLAQAKAAWEKAGYRVLGAALASSAARNLEDKTGIASETIRMRELQLFPGTAYVLKHHARQLWRAAQGKETFALPKLTLDAKTVLVLDEAGMVSTHDFAMLARAVVEQGGTLVAVGDEQQLSAIERPGAFAYLVKEVPGVRLAEIRRQKNPADQDAVKHIALGNAEVALEHYAQQGHLFVGHSRAQAEEQLVADWSKLGGRENPVEHRIFGSTRAEVARLNALCQRERIAAGRVDAEDRVTHHGQTFMAGDRVRFDASCRRIGVRKGEGGTVVATKDSFTGKYIAVQLDPDGTTWQERFWRAAKHHARQLVNQALQRRTEQLERRQDIVVLPLQTLNPRTKPYHGLSLAYASTTHLGQGESVTNSYVLLGGSMTSRELSYVQMSRHRERLWLYAGEDEAGRTLTETASAARPVDQPDNPQTIPQYSSLVGQMKTSKAQEMASYYQQRPLQQEIPRGR